MPFPLENRVGEDVGVTLFYTPALESMRLRFHCWDWDDGMGNYNQDNGDKAKI